MALFHNIGWFCLLGLFLFSACQPESQTAEQKESILKEIHSPKGYGGEPNLFSTTDGQLYLTWIAYPDDSTDVLQFSQWEKDHWGPVQNIAAGQDWFVNWADFPSLVAYPDGGKSLAAHWLAKRDAGTYNYDIYISQSTDYGKNWSSPFILHRDSIAAEHGFVSLLPLNEQEIFALWLDGRHTIREDGAMSLRTATFNRQGQLANEAELDHRICDCCQTDATMTSKGPVVVYRDRSEEEIRDIYTLRQVNGVWTEPQAIYKDNWKITGCPVNGPAIASQGNLLAVAWYTAAAEKPIVQLAFSADGGAHFEPPIRIDEGSTIGRVDIQFIAKEKVLISWMEQDQEEAAIKVRVCQKGQEPRKSFTISRTPASRKSGFPILGKVADQVVIAWTVVDSTSTRIQTGLIDYRNLQ